VSDDKVLSKVREMVLPEIERHGPIEAWIIDDTSFPKKGQHSVGVSHQYCGQLGKQANCQVAVTLSLAKHDASLPVAYRLYLPKAWAEDDERRRNVGVPEDVTFKTKPEIALDHIRWAHETGLPGKRCCWMRAMATTPVCVRPLEGAPRRPGDDLSQGTSLLV
jgi:SRSO17 transposase